MPEGKFKIICRAGKGCVLRVRPARAQGGGVDGALHPAVRSSQCGDIILVTATRELHRVPFHSSCPGNTHTHAHALTLNLQCILKSLYCLSSMATTYREARSGNINPPGFCLTNETRNSAINPERIIKGLHYSAGDISFLSQVQV